MFLGKSFHTSSKASCCGNGVPRNREELLCKLQVASELEHNLLCAYLFTAATLKQNPSEFPVPVSDDVINTLSRWKGMVTGVAVQEMLHLTLASNLISAMGALPVFHRKNFPFDPGQVPFYPENFRLDLQPYSITALITYFLFEAFDPTQMSPKEIKACLGFVTKALHDTPDEVVEEEAKKMLEGILAEEVVSPIESIGELYLNIAQGIVAIGEGLFIGDPDQQMTDTAITNLFFWAEWNPFAPDNTQTLPDPRTPNLIAVTNVESAIQAINTIIMTGEGQAQPWVDFLHSTGYSFPPINQPSHESIFEQLIREFGPTITKWHQTYGVWLKPERPVAYNPYPFNAVPDNAGTPVTRVTQPFSAEMTALYNDIYELMLMLLQRTFGRMDENSFEAACLVQTTIRTMVYVLGSNASVLTQLWTGHPDAKTTGPSFTIPTLTRTGVSPKKKVAWTRMIESFQGLAARALALSKMPDASQTVVTGSSSSETVADYLTGTVNPMLCFFGYRLDMVLANPQEGPPPEVHTCRGLNSCAGKGYGGSGTQPGDGACATADPHVCAGQNVCANQSGCGSPGPYVVQPGNPNYVQEQAHIQDHPSENSCKLIGACGSPILPGTNNTWGANTPPSWNKGGVQAVYDAYQGDVWSFARGLLSKRIGKELADPPPLPTCE